ncbi:MULTISPECIES: hypothetical protein [unclassified Chryseobacterium]|uniref:hypothetical protein n=1 Tax=unclassified Chryseobacterium TaxID=2593645 RepID=UPI00226A27A6|nr:MULTISPECIES: hypothetical protein [unclassified Chryseobacterium]
MTIITIETTSIKICKNSGSYLKKDNLHILNIYHFLMNIGKNAFKKIEFNFDTERKIFYVKDVRGQIFPDYYNFISEVENSRYNYLFDFDY